MKKTLFFHLIAAFSLGSFAAGAATKDVPIEPKLDEIFAPWDSTSSPGCALAVIRDGEVLYSRGYGMANLEHGISISPASVFYVGSVSKQFVAASIALLAEEGALDLDDDIRNYVPEIPEYDRPITIRHMIHHTSGLRDYLTLMALAGKSFADATSEEEVIDLLSRQQELNFSPGEEHLYSNSGYFLLAVIVKRSSGKSLREYAEEKIFAPLGMRHSHFHDDHTMFVTNRAEGHLEQDDGDWGLTRSRFALVGSGGLYTTVEDLYRWDQNFYDNRLGKGGSDFIEMLQTPGKLNDGEELDYAFGLNIGEYRGLDTVRHGGALGGYRSHLLRFPSERFSVAIECNLDAINLGPMADQVSDLYLEDKLAPKPKPKPPETTRQSESKPETATATA
jgi:CubicO group peptidase (beta-lactamase class C family)